MHMCVSKSICGIQLYHSLILGLNDCLDRKAYFSPISSFRCWDCKYAQLYQTSYEGAGDLNLGPPAFSATALSTEPSPQPLLHSFNA